MLFNLSEMQFRHLQNGLITPTAEWCFGVPIRETEQRAWQSSGSQVVLDEADPLPSS